MSELLENKQQELLEQLGAVPLTQQFMDRILDLIGGVEVNLDDILLTEDFKGPIPSVKLGCVFDFKDLTILGTYKPFTAKQQGVCPEVGQISVNGIGDGFSDVILNAYSHAVWLKDQWLMEQRYNNLKRNMIESGYRGVF